MVDALAEMIAHPGPVRARRAGPVPGARPADDPGGDDRARHHQELKQPQRRGACSLAGDPSGSAVGQLTQTGSSIRRLYFFIFL